MWANSDQTFWSGISGPISAAANYQSWLMTTQHDKDKKTKRQKDKKTKIIDR